MVATTMLHVRVDDTIKTRATQALAAMGLTVSDAVRILLTRVVADQAFPLELKVPLSQTPAAIEVSVQKKRRGAPNAREANKILAANTAISRKRKTV